MEKLQAIFGIFIITDHVNKGNVSLVWCPTGDMIGDFMPKPIQGALFHKFRDQIMGVVPAQDPGPGKAKAKTSPRETKNSNLVEERVQYIFWSHQKKKDGTTGVCWEK
jgi:hypothetical protein